MVLLLGILEEGSLVFSSVVHLDLQDGDLSLDQEIDHTLG